MNPVAVRRLRLVLLGLVLLDWSLPFGFLNGLFNKYRLFPTNITRIFAEHLMSPETFAAVLVVSASAPLFWVMGGLCATTVARCVRSWKTSSPDKVFLLVLALLQLDCFVLPELLLPYLDAHRHLPHALMDALFPPVPRGHGRFYEWLHLLGAALFAVSWWKKAPALPS